MTERCSLLTARAGDMLPLSLRPLTSSFFGGLGTPSGEAVHKILLVGMSHHQSMLVVWSCLQAEGPESSIAGDHAVQSTPPPIVLQGSTISYGPPEGISFGLSCLPSALRALYLYLHA